MNLNQCATFVVNVYCSTFPLAEGGTVTVHIKRIVRFEKIRVFERIL